MVLIVKDGCPFCDKFKDLKGLVIAKVIWVGEEPKMQVDESVMEIPVALPGLPALLDGSRLYVGQKPIEERLQKAMKC